MPKPALLRYLPNRPFPAYRHRLDHTPHPKNPQGHSYNQADHYTGPPLTPENWHRHTAYLWGIDLYNHAYWWEAHEAWEGPWKCSAGLTRSFLQGLIQTAAALVKWRQHQKRGQTKLYTKGKEKLEHVLHHTANPTYMGFDIPLFIHRLDAVLAHSPTPHLPHTPLIELKL